MRYLSLTLTLAVFLDSSMTQRDPLNRRTRTRIYGGVAGESGRPLPLCRFWHRQKLPTRNDHGILRAAIVELEFDGCGGAKLGGGGAGLSRNAGDGAGRATMRD